MGEHLYDVPPPPKNEFKKAVGRGFGNPALGLLWIRRSSSQKTDFKYTATNTLSGQTILQTANIIPLKYKMQGQTVHKTAVTESFYVNAQI